MDLPRPWVSLYKYRLLLMILVLYFLLAEPDFGFVLHSLIQNRINSPVVGLGSKLFTDLTVDLHTFDVENLTGLLVNIFCVI